MELHHPVVPLPVSVPLTRIEALRCDINNVNIVAARDVPPCLLVLCNPNLCNRMLINKVVVSVPICCALPEDMISGLAM